MSLPGSSASKSEPVIPETNIKSSFHDETEDPSPTPSSKSRSPANLGSVPLSKSGADEEPVKNKSDHHGEREETSRPEGIHIEECSKDVSEKLVGKMQGVSVSLEQGASGMNEAQVDKARGEMEGGYPAGSSFDGNMQDEIYQDPTPKTPRQGTSPSREPSTRTDTHRDVGSSFEIQSIMDQFELGEDEYYKDAEQNLSHLKSPLEHPPRRSSLEPLRSVVPDSGPEIAKTNNLNSNDSTLPCSVKQGSVPDFTPSSLPARNSSLQPNPQHNANESDAQLAPNSSLSRSKTLPPVPDPEPDLPFDFHRFLEQLRHRTADPVAKFLRSFLIEFGKKQWMVHEQVKIINDFLIFITTKMAQCEVWRGVSDAEFDNAKEGMEKLVMNRLYSQTFSPVIPVPAPVQGSKNKKKSIEKSPGPGRKGQHQEDIERDEILGQKVRIYGWVE